MDPILLTGSDAAAFRRRLFSPTKDEVQEQKERLRSLDQTITIYPTEDGWIATVRDLDLSFLRKEL